MASAPGYAPGDTIAAAIAEGCSRLSGTATPRLDAELLLAHVLGTSRAGLLARLRERLPAGAAERFRVLLERRARGEPLAYLTGQVGFYDLELGVSPATFVPRPETELLVEWGLGRLHARPGRVVVLDVGTGCGAIALVLARGASQAEVHATDISAAALAVARDNARRLGLGDRIRWHQADLLPPTPAVFDLVVANLPYVAEEDPDLDPAVAAFEPPRALYGGKRGLEVIGRLLAILPPRLALGADVGLEIGWRQAAEALQLAQAFLPHGRARIQRDLAGRDRLLLIEGIGCGD